jgi:hypothetical protein
MAAKPNSEGLIVVKYPGRLLTSEAAANWVRKLNDRIQVLHHMIEKETNRDLVPAPLVVTIAEMDGRTTRYGSRTPNQTKTGNNYQNVSANISGLSAPHIISGLWA